MSNLISILLIEDDLVDQMSVVAMAAKENLPYRFHTANSISEARRLLTARKYDVILADFQLPDGTSFDLFDLFLDKLVIFTTGSGNEEIAARAFRMGVRDYLIKDPDRHYLKLLPLRVDIALRQWIGERSLRESEQRYRDVVENATDLIQTIAIDGKIQFVNRAWLNAVGCTETETVGRSISDFIHPDYRQNYFDLCMRVVKGEVISGIETVFLAKDESSIFLQGNASCCFREGVPLHIRGIYRDVSERRKQEEEQKRIIGELRKALEDIEILNKLLPICAWCKKIRNDKGYWEEVSAYFVKRSAVSFTHGMCPECGESFASGPT